MEQFDLRKWSGYEKYCKASSSPVFIDHVAVDSRRVATKNTLFIALTGAHFDGHAFVKEAAKAGAKFAIVKEGFIPPPLTSHSMQFICVPDPLKALQEIAAAYRKEMPAKIIAITGSYGKTMLKDLLQSMLAQQYRVFANPESFNSQLGVALSLLKIKREHEIALIEAGISKPYEMEHHLHMIAPEHVIITNIGKAHISSLGSEEAIAKEKAKLLQNIFPDNWCLLPHHELLVNSVNQKKGYHFWDRPSIDLPEVYAREPESQFSLGYELLFPTEHRYYGHVREGLSYVLDLIRISAKAAHLLGIKENHIIKTLNSYQPEPMRIELWKTRGGATIINDTYCADPMSCDIALKQYESLGEQNGKRIFIFEGLRFDADHPESDMLRVAHAIIKNKVDVCIIPQQQHQNLLIAHLTTLAPRIEIISAKNLYSAIEIAKAKLQPHDIVIIKGPQKHAASNLIQAFDESLPNNQVIINLAAIQSNIDALRAKIGSQNRMMVMVKALAYGTDDVRIAKFLHTAGIDIFGVSYVDEGVAMREAGITQDIFVLNAAEYEAAKAVKWNLKIGVSEPTLIYALQKEAERQNKIVDLHLHVDTGMSRFGCKPEEALSIAKLIKTLPNLRLEGIFTHFSCADNPEQDSYTLQQAAILEKTIQTLAQEGIDLPWRHAAGSSAALRFIFPAFNMVRIGIATYGLHTSEISRSIIDLKPAISLVSRIVGINNLHHGDSVSYGRCHTVTNENAKIAVLPIGYFDGLHRNYSGKSSVLIRGKKAPMVGRICMDYMMCDITDIPLASIGDSVLIFGEDENGITMPAEELAKAGNSIAHELMTCLGPRIRRLFIYDESLRPR